jgi:hypothetical protein
MPAKFDRCVRDVERGAKRSGRPVNAYAVCAAAGTRNPSKVRIIHAGSPRLGVFNGKVYLIDENSETINGIPLKVQGTYGDHEVAYSDQLEWDRAYAGMIGSTKIITVPWAEGRKEFTVYNTDRYKKLEDKEKAKPKAVKPKKDETYRGFFIVKDLHGYLASDEQKNLVRGEETFTGSTRGSIHKQVDNWIELQEEIRRKGNPESDSASMYSSFHGSPSEEVIEFREEEHYHGNLAGLGVLVELKLVTITGYDVTLSFSNPDTLVASNPGIWDRLKKLSARGKDPWVTYKSFDTESVAREEVGKLESKGVIDVRVEKKNVGGRLLGRKFKYEVQIRRESMKRYFKERALDESLQKALKRQREAHRHEKSIRGPAPGSKLGSGSGSRIKTYTFKGHKIEEKDGEFIVPSIDRDSRFDSLKDAKMFITVQKRDNPGPFQSASKLIGGTGRYLDDQLGRVLNPSQDPALLCSNESGTQMYVQGGDQSIDLKSIHMDDIPVKDSMVLGECYFVSYFTEKDFEDFRPTIFEHDIAEESDPPSPKYKKDEVHTAKNRRLCGQGTGFYPTVRLDTLNQKLYLDGGVYFIKKPLMGTSPGLEN